MYNGTTESTSQFPRYPFDLQRNITRRMGDTDWEDIQRFMEKVAESNDTDCYNTSHSRLEEILNGKGGSRPRLDGLHVLVITLCTLAILINAMTITAIRHIRRRLSANQTMMFSLCCADLLTSVGVLARLINQQHFEIHTVADDKLPAAYCVYKVIQALIQAGHNATLCNLLCLAVDHYCAIAKPLTYSLYMSKRRVHIILGAIWSISALFGFSDFIIPAPLYSYCESHEYLVNYCERVWCTSYEPDHLMFCVVVVCLLALSGLYGCIMWILHRYQRQEYATASQRKVQRHIRGLVTSFIILGLFAVLWLPSCIFDAYIILRIHLVSDYSATTLHKRVYWYLYALVLLNAVCDPVVYAMRMREIQESLKVLLCLRRRTFTNKVKGFSDALRPASTAGMPLKYVTRQHSNSTNGTVNSAMTTPMSNNSSIHEHHSRKDTITSRNSELTEDTPLK